MVRLSTPVAATCLATALAFPACSRPNAVNEANFRRVLEAVNANAFCTPIGAASLETPASAGRTSPFPIVIAATPGPYERIVAPDARRELDDAASRGLLRRTSATVLARSARGDPFVPTPVLSYAPTPKGSRAFRAVVPGKPGERMRPVPSSCRADGAAVDVVRWTEPAEAFGTTVVRVDYRISPSGVVEEMVPAGERPRFEAPAESTAILRRTSDGWAYAGRR